jgi:hypothetical protein
MSKLVLKVVVLFLAIAIAWLALKSVAIRNAIDKISGPYEKLPALPLGAWRTAVACGVGMVVIGGSALDAFLMREHWPFSYYPMFIGVQESTITQRVVVCKGSLQDACHVFYPLNEYRLSAIITHIRNDSAKMGELCDSMCKMIREFDTGSQDVTVVQLCEFTWTIESNAINRHRPDKIEVLCQRHCK